LLVALQVNAVVAPRIWILEPSMTATNRPDVGASLP